MAHSLWPHGLQHTRLPCLLLSPGACSNSCPLSRWSHPTISSSVTPPFAFSLFHHQGLFQWAGSSHQVAKVLDPWDLFPNKLPAHVFVLGSALGEPRQRCVCVQSCAALCDPMDSSVQALLSLKISRPEYWSGLPFSFSLGELPDPGIQPMSLVSPALAGRFFITSTTWEAKGKDNPIFLKLRQCIFKWKNKTLHLSRLCEIWISNSLVSELRQRGQIRGSEG